MVRENAICSLILNYYQYTISVYFQRNENVVHRFVCLNTLKGMALE